MSTYSANADTPYRDPLDSFTDREQILTLFEQFLNSAQPGQLRILTVKGSSGTGKTFLSSYFTSRVCPQLKWQTGQISFAQATPDFRSVLTALESALRNCVPRQSLKHYRDKRDEYNHKFDEYRASITVNQSAGASNQSTISNVTQSTQIDVQLRERELHLRSELTHALLELSEESTRPLCLFIDSYERLIEGDPELDGWLWEKVLLEMAKAFPQPLLVVTCGWQHPSNAAIKPLSHPSELADFDLSQVRNYLEKQEIIVASDKPLSAEQEELVAAFYELTKGHPLVLGLGVTYFKQLGSQKRSAKSLRANRPLLNTQVRVEFLKERLLERLPKPHNLLLEWGPILRSFDQEALQELLNAVSEITGTEPTKLNYQDYSDFLNYPFIKQVIEPGYESTKVQRSLHELLREVSLGVLRQDHILIKERLHLIMAAYYLQRFEIEQDLQEILMKIRDLFPKNSHAIFPLRGDYAKLLPEIPDERFGGLLEWLYHSLQVKEFQASAFILWGILMIKPVTMWRRRQAGLLLELIQHLSDEGEPFLSKTSDSYSQYLCWHARFIEQELRWEEAREDWEKAAKNFEQVGNLDFLASCLTSIGFIYVQQGKLEQAMNYYNTALAQFEQMGFRDSIISLLNNIAGIYRQQGKLEQALSCLEKALALSGQVGSTLAVEYTFYGIGTIYLSRGEREKALSYLERALAISEQIDNPFAIAACLNSIGFLYQTQKDFKRSLGYYERALALSEKVGSPIEIAGSLNSIGFLYQTQGDLAQAMSYHERALALKEQIGNPAELATSLNNIGLIYASQGNLEQALSYYKRALVLSEQASDATNIGSSLNNIGSIYQKQGKLKLALDYYEQALIHHKQAGYLAGIAVSFHNIGDIYFQQGLLSRAIKQYVRALKCYERLGRGFESDVIDELEALAFCYAQLGEIEKAVAYNIRIKQIRELIKPTS